MSNSVTLQGQSHATKRPVYAAANGKGLHAVSRPKKWPIAYRQPTHRAADSYSSAPTVCTSNSAPSGIANMESAGASALNWTLL